MWVFSLEVPISVFEEKVDSMAVDASKTFRHFDQAMLCLRRNTARVRRCREVASEVSKFQQFKLRTDRFS